ncbi:toll/interleukin-1 receptor domain-containing protein [Algoriphagus resistens]|uniref:toll/interleukin-1 receptor domain-containing protein n=1 Tax=Algoriphagus resistens TaxID=1750590 RepID=UPI0007168824|nr:toll/interleukin-1 receptor domain-containing protein [Algoriphagus resistens]
MPDDSHHVFISYAWGGESEAVANEVDHAITAAGFNLIRDKRDLGFKGLIKEFMEKIGQGHAVILVISDKYLKSPNCMFELLEVQKSGDFYDRIFPLVLPDAAIYKSTGIISYLKYWEGQIDELNDAIKGLDSFADTQGIREEIDLYTDIRGAIAKLAATFRNMNTLTIAEMRSKSYAPLLNLLCKKESPGPNPSSKPNPRYGKILYHIPELMQVHEWTRCIVRLAWDEFLLTENLRIPDKEKIIEDIRLGQVMQVSLEEGRDSGSFEIKELSSTEQLILSEDFTEWLFDVKAIREGTFTLMLRVTLLQIIEGFGPRKKDLVLERKVTTKALAPEALPVFETRVDRLRPYSPNQENIPPYSPEENNAGLEKAIGSRGSIPSTSSTPSPYINTSKRRSPFRKIIPFAASITLLVVAGVLFLSQSNDLSSPTEGTVALEEKHDINKSPLPSAIEGIEPPTTAAPPPMQPPRVLVAINSRESEAGIDNSTLLFYTTLESVDSLAFDSLQVNFYLEGEVDFPSSIQVETYSAKEIKDSVQLRRLNLVQRPVVANPVRANH